MLDEARLTELLDRVAADGRVTSDARDELKVHSRRMMEWRNEGNRPFSELLDIAKKIGDVREWQRLRGITIEGKTQFVMDPALLARFGFPDDDESAETAAMFGFAHYPFALDADGQKIPLMSPRHPRPQRQHRKYPLREYQKPKPSPHTSAVSEQSCGADRGLAAAKQRGLALPPYARGVNAKPVPRPFVVPAVPAEKPMTPLRAELMARAAALKEHGPAHPKPIDRDGRPTFAAVRTAPHADDPPERNTV